MENTKKTTLTEYFDAIDRRLVSMAGGDFGYNIKICGKLIRLHFDSKENADLAAISLTGMITEEEGPIDAHFSYWTDDSDNYLPHKDDASGIWNVSDETGELKILSGSYLRGIDTKNRRFYMCICSEKGAKDLGYAHAMINLINLWAKYSGYILFHGAVAGIDGKGVIIAGRGGAGKSTLSITCLKRGMQFIADDYFLLSGDGELTAFPIYRTVGLNPDSAERLGMDLPVVRVDEKRGGKLLYDASSMNYSESLDVKGVIFPEIAHTDRPEITLTDSKAALTQIIHSSVSQFEEKTNAALIMKMAQRLKDLPIYELKLSTDTMLNSSCLEDFIREKM